MIARNHKFQFGGGLLEEFENGFVFGEVPDIGDVAAMDEDVAGGKGLPVGVLGVGGRERRDGMRVGDDAETGFYCWRRHGLVVECPFSSRRVETSGRRRLWGSPAISFMRITHLRLEATTRQRIMISVSVGVESPRTSQPPSRTVGYLDGPRAYLNVHESIPSLSFRSRKA